MDEKGLKRLLHVGKQAAARPGRRCPDETQLAAYVEHRLSASQEARVESHLADCAVCLERVAFLTRFPASGEATVAPHALSRAKDLVPTRPSAWPGLVVRWGTVAAVAACLVLAVLQLRQPGVPLPGSPPAQATSVAPGGVAVARPGTGSMPRVPIQTPAPAGTGTPATVTSPPPPAPPRSAVRHSVASPPSLALLFPTESSTVLLRDLEFRWQAVPGTDYYEIHIVTEEGDVVWQGKVEGTTARVPGAHPLQPGAKYFVWVRAYLSGGGTVKSAAVSFRVGD